MIIEERVRDVEVLLRERKCFEEDIIESKAKLESILDSSPYSITVTDLNGKIIQTNKATLKLYGFVSKDDLIGKSAFMFISEQDCQRALENMKNTFEDGEMRNIEYTLIKKNGTEFFGEISASVVRDSRGNATGFVAITTDITERKAIQDRLLLSYGKLKEMTTDVIMTISKLVEMKDPYTAGHQRRVSQLALAIAKAMGLSEDETDGIRIAGLIHDIGKLYVPAEILSKPAHLTDAEFDLIKIHPEAGYGILKIIKFPWPVAAVALQHQERLNGSGYPSGLRGEAIMPETRIISVADVVEAMSFYRPYRDVIGLDKALDEIVKNKGTLYDEKIVDICVGLFHSGKFVFV